MTILAVLGPVSGLAQQAVPEQGPPPTNLEQRGEGYWTANEAPPEDTSAFQVHTVVMGDTLWAIASTYMDDPFLWPQIWEANSHIVNPHWIYPQDIILIRPVTAITEVIPPPPPVPEPEPEQAPREIQIPTLTNTDDLGIAPDRVVFDLPEPRRVPTVKPVDLYCSGFVTTREYQTGTSQVIGRVPPGEGLIFGEGSYLYVSRGSDEGVSPGDVLNVLRPTREVRSTRSGIGTLGLHYLELGQMRAVIVQPSFSLARIVHSCGEITVGDIVTDFEPIDFPELPPNRPFSPFMASTGGTAGAVALTRDIMQTAGTPALGGSSIIAGYRKGMLEDGPLRGVLGGMAANGRIVYLDLGTSEGIEAGDIFLVYRPMEFDRNGGGQISIPSEARDLLADERYVVGEVVVVKVEERASTALVTFSSDGISPGDLVERR